MDELLQRTAQRAQRYLAGLRERSVAPTSESLERLKRLERPMPQHACSPEEVIAELDEFGSPATVASAGPRFFGFVIGGSLPATLASSWLASTWDQNGGLVATSPVNAALESIALRWLLDVLALPAECAGGFVTCATAANFTAMAAARHALLAREGWDVEAQGLFGAPPIEVIVGDEVHASAEKALAMVGFGRSRVRRVPCDAQGQMRLEEFPKLASRTLVCVQAGNVNTGGFDPIGEICERARASGAWVHVDAAFGLWARAAPAYAHIARGMEHADSWATDAHKWLNVPYDSGLVFVRDAAALRTAMSAGGAYLSQEEARVPYQYTPDFSRRARGVEVWAALRQLGRAGLADLIERTCQFARRFAAGLAEAGYEILCAVQLNQVLVSFGTAEQTREVIARIQADGTCWCGGTVWQERTAMRISVSGWATTERDVELSLAAMVRIAAGVVGKRAGGQ
jgi:glutamate/tyrosine decarboxylase-like PLP-dependent enzyme